MATAKLVYFLGGGGGEGFKKSIFAVTSFMDDPLYPYTIFATFNNNYPKNYTTIHQNTKFYFASITSKYNTVK